MKRVKRVKVLSLPSLWKIYRDAKLIEASGHDVQVAHDAFFGAILAYSKALNHALEHGDLENVAESIRKLAATVALAQKVARGPTH